MVYLICSSQTPYETSIFITTSPIRKHTPRHLMNHPHYTACKWQLGSNLLTPLHFPLHHSCLWPRDTPQQPSPLVPPSEFHFNHCHGLLSSWIIKYRGFCLDWLWLLQSNSPLSKCFHTSFILTTFQVIPTNWKLYFRLNTRRTEWGAEGVGAGGGRRQEGAADLLNARSHSLCAAPTQVERAQGSRKSLHFGPSQVDRLLETYKV